MTSQIKTLVWGAFLSIGVVAFTAGSALAQEEAAAEGGNGATVGMLLFGIAVVVAVGVIMLRQEQASE